MTIKSVTDNNRSLTVTVNPGDPTIIDCQKSRIYNSSGTLRFSDLGIGDYSEIYWLRLYNGENELQITGKATVEISWREPRKVGAY